MPDNDPHRSRSAGIDALRVGTTLLVVLDHTAITYGAAGGWYYKEVQPDGSWSSMLLVFLLHAEPGLVHGAVLLAGGLLHPGPAAIQGILDVPA